MDNYIEHHGILGQKWGVRRYQNPDGTLTNAGKKHYNPEQYKSAANQARESASTMERVAKNHNPNAKKQAKEASTLSNKELQERINRMNLEQQYVNLTSNPSRIEKGASYAKEALEVAGAALGIAVAIKTLRK